MQAPKFPISLRRFVFAWLVIRTVIGLLPAAVAAPVDYLVDDWDTENNLPSSTVTSIAQTPDGYLWIGTYNGLARFDGARFVTFDPVNQAGAWDSRGCRGFFSMPAARSGSTPFAAG